MLQVEFLECALPPAEDSCMDEEFHCVESRACVSLNYLCDFSDDCGDSSDEEVLIFPYTRVGNCDLYIF